MNTDVPAFEGAAGWHAYEQTGFSLWVPDSWKLPDEEDAPAGMSFGELQNLGSVGAAYEVSQVGDQLPGDFVMQIVDKTQKPIPGEPVTGLTVSHLHIPGGSTLKNRAEVIAKELMGEETFDLSLPCGPAKKIQIKQKMITGDEVYRMWFIIVNETDIYAFLFEQTGGQGMVLKQNADNIMQTLRLAPPAK